MERKYGKDEEIPAGTKIIIHVSMGIEQVEVPDLTGKTLEEAKKAISDAKLKFKSSETISDSGKANGVVYQSISSGSMVDKDTEITIKINEYQAMIHGTITINVASLQKYVEKYEKVADGEDEEGNKKYKEVLVTPNKVEVIVTVNDEQVDKRTVSEDTKSMQVGFDGKDTVTIKVKIDGSTKATKDINLNSQNTITIE